MQGMAALLWLLRLPARWRLPQRNGQRQPACLLLCMGRLGSRGCATSGSSTAAAKSAHPSPAVGSSGARQQSLLLPSCRWRWRRHLLLRQRQRRLRLHLLLRLLGCHEPGWGLCAAACPAKQQRTQPGCLLRLALQAAGHRTCWARRYLPRKLHLGLLSCCCCCCRWLHGRQLLRCTAQQAEKRGRQLHPSLQHAL